MTAQPHQGVTAPAGYVRPEPAPRATGRPLATVAAAARATATRPRPPAAPPRPAGTGTTRTRPHPAAVASTVRVGHTDVPPRERPARREPLELPLLRIVCWQVAVVLVLLAIGRPWPILTALLLAAVALLAWTAVRVRGRWLSAEATLRARLLLRRRRCDLPGAHAADVLLRTFAPGARIHTVALAGSPAAVVSRNEELLAVLRPAGADPAALAELALSGALLPDAADPQALAPPAVRLQLVLHHGPQQTEHARAWLAVRAVREPGCAGDADLLVPLTNAVRRVQSTLRRAGLAVVALTGPELHATLVALTHTGPGRGAIREDRRYWRAGPIAQAGLRLTGLAARSPRARVHTLHRLLAAAAGTARTVAVTVPEYAGVLRVAARLDATADAAADQLRRTLPSGLRLERMDDQHAAAVAASLPIGGNP
ncbi:type VII secretion protein EccE [Prauserella oleivorans]|uniref:Type VII secretion protein EccE n=1 Tax=Prauserella oleivorans TaxID=1478153 RepID=A0ABW5W9Y8_9PSEU